MTEPTERTERIERILPPGTIPRIHLLPGRDKRIRGGHPWIYSNEVRMDAEAKAIVPGSLVTLHRVDGKPYGVGTFNQGCLIAYRQFSPDPNEAVDTAFIARRIERALALRQRLFTTPYYRLIHGEADGLPGIVIDRFDNAVTVQTASAGADILLPAIQEALDTVIKPTAVVLRNDGAFRRLENLEAYTRVVKGDLDSAVAVHEETGTFHADLATGQKTGWYFDQRRNRAFAAGLVRSEDRVLDVFCHTGAFAVATASAGAAEVIGVDSSEGALALAHRAAETNGVAARCTFVKGDAFQELERLGNAKERFDLVIADPPAFVKSRKDLNSGLKGYRKLARLSARLVAPGGFLFIASCSHNVEAGAFAQEIAGGLERAGRVGRILRAAGAGPDHPVHPHLAESAYLKTLTLQLD